MHKILTLIVFIFGVSYISFSQPISPCDSLDPFSAKFDSCVKENHSLVYLMDSPLLSNERFMTISPNPNSNGQLHVNIFGLKSSNIRLEILNLHKEVLYQQFIKGVNSNFFSLTDLSSLKLSVGMYFVRCYVGEKMLLERLIIDK